FATACQSTLYLPSESGAASGTINNVLSPASSFGGPVLTAVSFGPFTLTVVNLSSRTSENLSLSSTGGLAVSFAAGVEDTSCAWAKACPQRVRLSSKATENRCRTAAG